MSDWIVIRGTGTRLDGTWIDRPFRWASRLTLGPCLTVVPTPGFEQDDEKGVAEVWRPEGWSHRDILFKVESTYGSGSPPDTPRQADGRGRPGSLPTLDPGGDHLGAT